MRELRNCHIKGNFVTETALSIGAVETNTLSGIYAVQWVVLKHHEDFSRQFGKICEYKSRRKECLTK